MEDLPYEPPGIDELEPEGPFSTPENSQHDGLVLGVEEAWDEWEDDDGGVRQPVASVAPEQQRVTRGTAPTPGYTRVANNETSASHNEEYSDAEAESVREKELKPFPPLRGLAVTQCAAGLREDMALMVALAEAASHASHRTDALVLIAASVPLSLRRYPELYGALQPLLPALLRASGRLAERWYTDPRTRPRLASFPALLTRAVRHLAQCSSRGQRISPASAERALLHFSGLRTP